jgi:hypothetical protein
MDGALTYWIKKIFQRIDFKKRFLYYIKKIVDTIYSQLPIFNTGYPPAGKTWAGKSREKIQSQLPT